MTNSALTNTPATPAPPKAEAGVRTSYRRLIMTGLVTFLFLFGGVFLWMAIFPISGAVIAHGSVVVRGKPKLVQHLDGGIIKEILVANGDAVRQGDVLVRLDDAMLKANMEIYRNRLREAWARRARLFAERDGAETVTYEKFPDDIAASIGDDSVQRLGQERLFVARQIRRRGQIEQLQEKIRQFDNQTVGTKGMMRSRREQLGFIVRELEGLRRLRDKELVTETRVLALEARRAELEGQLSENEADLARIDNSIRETQIAILQVDREFQESVLTELRDVSSQTDELVQQIGATTRQLERIDIKSPVNGIVHEQSVYTIGGVVPPGGTLMQLIAADQGVELEVTVEPQSIDQVHIGQKAAIRFPAFNQRTTPELSGKVNTISASSIMDEKTGASFYRVGVAVSSEEMARLGELQLVPGMPAEAIIETTPRTVLSFIFKPLYDSLAHTFREE